MKSPVAFAPFCLRLSLLAVLVLFPEISAAARLTTYYFDADGDGYGNTAISVKAASPPPGYVAMSGDCNDADSSINPGAVDICGDAVDQDCSSGDDACSAGKRLYYFYFDADSDGYGDSSTEITARNPPAGYVSNMLDCNDGDASAHPGGIEVCDGVDNDCDALTDEGLTGTFFRDADADTFGDAADSASACAAPAGYVANADDCNDAAPAINPAATDICDGVDNDCNMSTGDGSGASAPFNTLQDGVCAGSLQSCTGGAWIDTYAGIGGYEAAESTCDTLDNDCDALTDEGLTGTFFRDADLDGFGDAADSASACAAPAGYVANADDCNDAAPAINPAATEICGDGIDQNCDGSDAVCSVVTFEKRYGGSHRDWSRNVEQTPDGGYIMAGYEYYTVNQQVFTMSFAIKTDALGNTVWNRTYDKKQRDYGRVVIHRTPDGGYAILGTGWNTATTRQEMFLLRTDADGIEQWTSYFGDTGAGSGFDFKVTSDGGFIMVGEKFTNELKSDVVLVKTDASGTTTWATIFSYASYERANSVIETSDGGYAFFGYTSSFGAGYDDFFFMKTDALGTEEWHRTYGTTGWEVGYSLRQTDDGGYILFGDASTLSSNKDMYLIKTDQSGVTEWSATYGGSQVDGARDVRQTSDGGYVLVGYTDSFGQEQYAYDIYLLKTDAGGVEQWSKIIGYQGTEVGEGVELTADGAFAVIGTTNSIGAGDYDFYLVKTDAAGNFQSEYCRDADGDGFGDSTQCLVAVGTPPGYVGNSTDCNDADPGVYPGAVEIPGDFIDQDCDGRDSSLFYRDADVDGYGNSGVTIVAVTPPLGYVFDNTDCNDANMTIYPGAPEICGDGIDQDCDGFDADVCIEVYFRDADGDGFGNPNESIVGYPPPPPGYVVDNTDCNDGDPGIHPGAIEIPGDGIDQDCDGQDPADPWRFLRTYGGSWTDSGYMVEQTMDGGYFIAGVSDSYAGYELYAIKTDRFGVTEWSRTYGGLGWGTPVAGRATQDGGYVLVGSGSAAGLGSQILLLKLDLWGNVMWSRTYGGTGVEYGRDVRQTMDGGFAVFGDGSDSYGMLDFVLVKTDANGNLQWLRSYGDSGMQAAGGLALTADGGYAMAGTTEDLETGILEALLVKADIFGQEQWSQVYSGPYGALGRTVEQTTDGGYALFGMTPEYGSGYFSMYLVKTDAAGLSQWTETYGGMMTEVGCARQTPDGGYILLGSTSPYGSEDLLLVKTDPSGGYQWDRIIGGPGRDRGFSLDLTSDGGYVLLGDTTSYGSGWEDVLLVKTDAYGNY